MRLGRITPRFGDLPDLYTFECRACGVSHIAVAPFESRHAAASAAYEGTARKK
jgi:hypothetical protein